MGKNSFQKVAGFIPGISFYIILQDQWENMKNDIFISEKKLYTSCKISYPQCNPVLSDIIFTFT